MHEGWKGEGLACEGLPLREGRGAPFLAALSTDEMAFEGGVVAEIVVDGSELL